MGIGDGRRTVGLKDESRSTAKIILINEGTGRRGIKGIVSIKNVTPSHASEIEEIFPEKTLQKARRHLYQFNLSPFCQNQCIPECDH